MRSFILTCFILSNTAFASAGQLLDSKIDSILLVSEADFELSIELANDLLDEYNGDESGEGLVQSNFILGYLYYQDGDYEKSIIYYLEAIRYAEKSSYDGVEKTLPSLFKNCGVIFRKYKAFDLAKKYYHKGLELAKKNNDAKQIVGITYNLSSVLIDEGNFSEAANLLQSLITNNHKIGSNQYYNILTRLCYANLKEGNNENALLYANEILKNKDTAPAKFIAYAYQNKGAVYLNNGEHEEAEGYFQYALSYLSKEKTKDNTALFNILFDQGRNWHLANDNEKALLILSQAEELINTVTQQPEYFDIYKSIANIYFDSKQFQKAKKYEDLHTDALTNYLNNQEKILETDRRYNMDLITKRYFDQVEKQERISTILFYSKLISGSLLTLLLFAVAYNRYEKLKLRRTISKELAAIGMMDS